MTTKSIDALTARAQFGDIMNKVEKNKTQFLVSRRGKPAVVILSVADYMQNFVKKSPFMVEIQKDAVRAGLDKMTDAEINAEIQAVRKNAKK